MRAKNDESRIRNTKNGRCKNWTILETNAKKILDESKMKHSFNKDALKRRIMSVTTQSCKSQDHPKLDLHLKNQSEWILIEFSFLQTVFLSFLKSR